MSGRPKIAIAIGDPAGIGPEIALKAALEPAVREACHPVLVGEANLIERHAAFCSIDVSLCAVARIGDIDWTNERIPVLNCDRPAAIPLGAVSASAGHASISFCAAAIEAAKNGEVDAVAAAPQNETSIAKAGIAFDGHPSFLARQTGTPEDDVFMMLACEDMKIAHVTLHRSVRDAIELVIPERVERTIRATDAALKRLGTERPRIAVSGLNPHAGEGGLFGREEIEVIAPAVAAAAASGIAVIGPFGADTMFQMKDVDAFVVMLHDQGHIAAKVLAPNAAVAFSIGSPILFASVAHGTGHDIAGQGVANPAAMIDAVLRLSKVRTHARA
jgi:4-hydroxythreonine-4-phosphate dehydrogenase